jgi:hypothetical protein
MRHCVRLTLLTAEPGANSWGDPPWGEEWGRS